MALKRASPVAVARRTDGVSPWDSLDIDALLAPHLDEALAALDGRAPLLAGMVRYHFGEVDATFRPSAVSVDRGKRIRPALAMLSCGAVGGNPRSAAPLAAAIELLHNFTLIHDDIEDQDPARHHRPTVWSVWGVPQAINAGDGMYAVSRLAVQRLRALDFPPERILDFASLMDRTCVRVCEGQFLDISFESRTDITADRYRVMAARKTGALFAASAQSAGMLASDDPTVREQLGRFGEEFGQAFQAHDDLLGIWASTERTGKVEMNDLVKRKKTLPVVLAFERASPRIRTELDELFAPQAPLPAENVERIRQILDDLGVRPMLEREIEAHRARALHLLRAVAASEEPLRLLEHLVASATGAANEPAAAGTVPA